MLQSEALEILKSGRNVFLTGEPGAGKSYLIERFREWLEEKNIEYAITASTGIAASHLDGVTIHSFTGIGIKRNLHEKVLDGIARNSWLVEKVKPVKVLIIDEVSMLDAVILEDINAVLQKIHDNSYPFGGVQIVFVGDFFQLPPVVRNEEQVRFAFEANCWIEARPEICYLHEQHRQSDQEFLEILAAMRNGTISESQIDRLKACTLDEKPATQLYTHNADVDRINQAELDKLPGKPKTFEMTESGNPNQIETLKRNCLSPEKLTLKVGAVVMFTRNNMAAGYVNGSIGKIVSFSNGNPVVKLLSGSTVIPEKAKWSMKKRNEEKAWIKQIPLRLAWAITVHKSQGMSLDAAWIDLSKTFEFGQGYVAISRVRTLKGLHLEGVNEKTFLLHPRVVQKDKEFRK